MLTRILLAALLSFLPIWFSPAQVRQDGEQAYEGRLFLKNGATLKGRIQYETNKPFVLLHVAGRVKAYNVSQVESFEFLDFEANVFRWFYALPFEEKGRKREDFFELLADGGSVALLSRENQSRASFPMGVHANGWIERDIWVNTYYMLNKDTYAMHTLPDNPKNVLELFPDGQQAMEQYVKEQKMDLQNRNDLIKLFYYYRQWQQATASIPY
jgi:hypothetical protein